MSRRAAAWLAWSLCLLCVALASVELRPLSSLSYTERSRLLLLLGCSTSSSPIGFSTVGALIASRRPRTP